VSDGEAARGIRLLVCGGRDYIDAELLHNELDAFATDNQIETLIHGDAPGADRLAAAWAEMRGVPVEAYPADWKRHGYSAGPIRNRKMIAEGKPDFVIAFPGGSGTADCIRQARAAGITVTRVSP